MRVRARARQPSHTGRRATSVVSACGRKLAPVSGKPRCLETLRTPGGGWGVLLPPGSSGAYLPPGCVQTHSAVLPVLEKQVGLTPLHRPACCVAAGGVSGTDGSYTIRTQISAWCEQREVPWRLCSPPDLTTPSPPPLFEQALSDIESDDDRGSRDSWCASPDRPALNPK